MSSTPDYPRPGIGQQASVAASTVSRQTTESGSLGISRTRQRPFRCERQPEMSHQKEVPMRASTKILETIDHVLTWPGWTYSAMWHFPPFAPMTWAPSRQSTPGRSERETSR